MTKATMALPKKHNHRLVSGTAFVTCVLLTGCRSDMQDQPKLYPQRASTFYSDGRSVRPQVPETVARSQGGFGDYVRTGLIAGKEGSGLPVALTDAVLARGRERYNVYCSPCHSRVGNGLGEIVERGYHPATSLHSTRLREAPLGHFFQVITKGYGAMPNYAAEVDPLDRWAIAAYIRALQLSQNARAAEIGPTPPVQKLTEVVSSEGFAPGFLNKWSLSVRIPAPPVPSTVSAVATASTPWPAATRNRPLVETTMNSKPADVVKQPTANAAEKPAASSADLPGTTRTKMAAGQGTTPVGAAQSAKAGQQIYLRSCSNCHQPTRLGVPPVIPGLIGIVSKVGDNRIRDVVTNGVPTGKPPMPAFSTLSADDLDNLIAFLKTD